MQSDRMPVADILQWPYADADPAVTVAWRNGAAIDNRTLQSRIAAWRHMLAAQPGRKFALFMLDSVEFCAALYGAWLAAKTVYLPGDTLPATCTSLAASVDGFIGDFDHAWAPLASPHSLEATRPEILPALAADFEALVVYTSGSSGDAQAIPKRLSQLATEVAMLEAFFGSAIGPAEILSTVSHQHIYGLLFKILWPLAARRPLLADSAVFLEELLPQMQRGPCVLVSSPAHLKRFPERPSGPEGSPASLQLRAVFSSGGPLTPEAAAATCILFGCMPVEIYGSSETGGIAWRRRGGKPDGITTDDPARSDSWTALPGVAWRIDAAGQSLQVRSSHLRDDGWLRMADCAAAVASATDRLPRFILLGRSDRIVKLEEKRISLDAIERGLCASPLVQAAKVLLHTPALQRAGTAAFVVLNDEGREVLARDGKNGLVRRLKTALTASVSAIAMPRHWRYLDALPVNAQGKTPQAQLLMLLEEKNTAVPRPTMPPCELQHRDADTVVLTLDIVPDLLYFDGHFTAAPVLPGVVQLDWAIDFGRRYFDLPANFKSIHALKFQQVVRPATTITLELQQDQARGRLCFRFHSANGQHASGQIAFTAGQEPSEQAQQDGQEVRHG